MFIFDWIYRILEYAGVYQRNRNLIFLGLDNSGKSTLLWRLKEDKHKHIEPGQSPLQSEEFVIENIRFRVFMPSPYWKPRILKEYLAVADGVIFIVDSSDRERFEESKKELDMFLRAEELKSVPFAILGNKIDLVDAVSEEELRLELGLDTYGCIENDENASEGARPVKFFMCSVAKKWGYPEAFKWLSQYV